MYASMQLGGEKEAIEQAQVGALQLARVSVGALGPVVDDLNVFNLPFLFRDTAHMEKVIDGPIRQELFDKVTNNPNTRLIGRAWMDAGARSLYDTKKPIKKHRRSQGAQKMRVMGNPMFVDMMNALGGNGVAMGYDQMFSALQTGVVDGAESNPPSSVFDNHLPRLSVARSAFVDPSHDAHGGDGDDTDRLCLERRLCHGADAGAGTGHGVLC
jgi:TRAP-type C4-dicarboxylate transport system substrate-binding protein